LRVTFIVTENITKREFDLMHRYMRKLLSPQNKTFIIQSGVLDINGSTK